MCWLAAPGGPRLGPDLFHVVPLVSAGSRRDWGRWLRLRGCRPLRHGFWPLLVVIRPPRPYHAAAATDARLGGFDVSPPRLDGRVSRQPRRHLRRGLAQGESSDGRRGSHPRDKANLAQLWGTWWRSTGWRNHSSILGCAPTRSAAQNWRLRGSPAELGSGGLTHVIVAWGVGLGSSTTARGRLWEARSAGT